MSSIAQTVVGVSAAVLIATLVLTGLGTAGVLHLRAVRSLDATLLAAAHAYSGQDAPFEVEHSTSPVEVWIAAPGQERVPRVWMEEVEASERPHWYTWGDDRYLLLVAEIAHHDDEEEEDHFIVVATAPRVTLVRSIGFFAVGYSFISGMLALAGVVVQRSLVTRAFLPLERARQDAAHVVGFGNTGLRLVEEGPAEVRSLLHDINALLERLEHAYRVQSRFTSEAAHELRTPVTVMLGEVELALRRPRSGEEYRASLTSLREEIERMRALVEALLALARLDAGQVGRARETLVAEAVARGALTREQWTLQEAGCSVELSVTTDAEITVDRTLLETALANLLRNAARYAPGKPVHLSVQAQGPSVSFIVDDHGPGVPEAERETVFDRFVRLGEARRRFTGGLGLGLPLAREVARQHGGDCVLVDAPGGGCRAVLTLIRSPISE